MNVFRFASALSICFLIVTALAKNVKIASAQVGWSEEKNLIQAGTIDNRVTTPSIAVNGDNVYIVYRQKQIKFIRSTDKGKTWSEPTVINNDQAINNYPAIAVFDSNIVVVWSSFVRDSSGLNTF